MKALLCSNELLLTGAPLFLTELACALNDIDITIYSPADGPLKERLTQKGIKVTHELNVNNYDLIMANTLLMHEPVKQAIEKHIPVVWMIHESDPTIHNVPSYTGKLLTAATHVVFPCCATASVYDQYCSDNSSVINAVIAPFEKLARSTCRKQFNLSDSDFLILNVGTIEHRKGQRDLIQSVAGLPVKCFLVGRLAHTDELTNLPANTTVFDATPNIHAFYAAADLYVCCSRVEAFPRSIMEAAEYNLPIITSPAFGIRDLIKDQVNGLYYRYGRISDLRNKITGLMTKPRQFQPLSHLISFEDMVKQYRELMEMTLSCPV